MNAFYCFLKLSLQTEQEIILKEIINLDNKKMELLKTFLLAI